MESRLNILDQQLESLLEELAAYDDELLNRLPAEGQWSALQVMHHLLLAESGSLAYLQKKLSYQPELKPAGLKARIRQLLLAFYLSLPFKFKAPANVSGESLPARSTLKETSGQWRRIRSKLREFLQELPEEVWDKEVYRHPFAGRMSLHGMLAFFDTHFKRHRQQIYRTLRQVGE